MLLAPVPTVRFAGPPPPLLFEEGMPTWEDDGLLLLLLLVDEKLPLLAALLADGGRRGPWFDWKRLEGRSGRLPGKGSITGSRHQISFQCLDHSAKTHSTHDGINTRC